MHRAFCRGCGHAPLTSFLDLGCTPLANRLLRRDELHEVEPTFPLEVFLCEVCSLVQLCEVVPPEVLFRQYVYVTGTSATMPKHFGALADALFARFLSARKAPLVVEAGSNDGTLLSAFQQHGVTVCGVEPAENICALANARGVQSRNDFFGESSAKAVHAAFGAADLVLACNVFAHVDDIHDFVRGVTTLLTSDGVFVVEAPYLLDFLEKLEFDTVYHEHLYYFSITALQALFARHSLQVFDVQYQHVHGGTVRVFVQREGGPHATEARLAEFLEREAAIRVAAPARYVRFAEDVYALKKSLRGLLARLKGEGARIVGYGCPAKGNTLLNFMEIGAEFLDYLVDKSPMKQGLFAPGTQLPIYPVERLLQDQPSYTLLLAWNFADEIISQQQDYLAAGGRFIIPLPHPRVVASDAL